MKITLRHISVLGLFLLLFAANSAHAAPITMSGSKGPNIQITSFSSAELTQKGCLLVTAQVGDYNTLTWTYESTHAGLTFFIPKDNLEKEEMKYTDDDGFETFRDWYTNTFSCPPDISSNIIAADTAANSSSWWNDPFAAVINNLFDFVDATISWLMEGLTSKLFLTILQHGVFIQSDIVKAGWPFIQGITNLGFIFVLLYIALATTLRLESVSTSVQRLLPKLLMGALLVNFSLVIGGLIIDASRLVMAIELRFVGGGEVSDGKLISEILEHSKTIETSSATILGQTSEAKGYAGIVLTRLQSTIVRLALTLGLLIIALNLFVRYVALLILLIFSPIAYLAMVLPQTKDFSIKWWSYFIKWVLYGPIVLFFMIIITKISTVNIPDDAGILPQVAQFCVAIALLYGGHIAGKNAAGAGSSAVMGFAAKHPRAALAVGGVLTGGVLPALGLLAAERGARMAGTGVKNAGRDIYNAAGANLKNAPVIKPIRDFMGYGLRDDKGNIKTGKSSWASAGANALTEKFNSSLQKDVTNIRELMDNETGQLMTAPSEELALMPSQLKKGHVVGALGNNEKERNANIEIIMKSGSQAQRMALAQNKDHIASLSSTQMAQLQQIVQKSVPDGKDKTAVLERMIKTVDELDKK